MRYRRGMARRIALHRAAELRYTQGTCSLRALGNRYSLSLPFSPLSDTVHKPPGRSSRALWAEFLTATLVHAYQRHAVRLARWD